MTVDLDVNIASSEFKADPFPFYRRLREIAPFYRVKTPDRQMAWLVTRYSDVVTCSLTNDSPKMHFACSRKSS